MSLLDEYDRTVVGYHGTSLSSAVRLVNRIESFRKSERDFEWLGYGVYFWEYGPQQAVEWAELRRRQLAKKRHKTPQDRQRLDERIAVVASMIRLGVCFDLLDPGNVAYLSDVFTDYCTVIGAAGIPLPRNTRKYRRLDCAVFDYAYKAIETAENRSVDTSRGVYVPSGGNRRLWSGSWVSRETHIQLCVRNAACIRGTWLHHPVRLEAEDVKKALEGPDFGIEPDHPPGGQEVSGDAPGPADRPDGRGEGTDPRASSDG